MDEYEAEYLRGRVRELERSRGRWRIVAGLLAGVLGAFALAAALTGLVALPLALRQEAASRQVAVSNVKPVVITEAVGGPVELDPRAPLAQPPMGTVAGGLGLAALPNPGDD